MLRNAIIPTHTVLAVLSSPLWLPLLFCARYNGALSLLDNFVCFVISVTVPVSSKNSLERNVEILTSLHTSGKKRERLAFEKLIAARKGQLTYTVEQCPSADGMLVDIHVTTPNNPMPRGRPICVVLHGGGMVAGHACGQLAYEFVERYGSTHIVASVEYRVAIDGHKWPKGLEDVLAAIRHLAQSSNGRELVLTGASSGGYLCLAVAMALRDDQSAAFTCLRHVLPIAPSTHIDFDRSRGAGPSGHMGVNLVDSRRLFEVHHSLSLYFMRLCWCDILMATDADRRSDVHDLRQKSHSELPPMTFILAAHDITHAEAVECHERILAAGGASNLLVLPCSHSAVLTHKEPAQRAFDEVLHADGE